MAIWREDKGPLEVLLGKRKGSHGAGEYSFPGGKIDGYEHPSTSAIREVREETGCKVWKVQTVPYWSHETYPELPFSFVTLYFSAQLRDGEVVMNMEPDKCEGWIWVPWTRAHLMPRPLFAGISKMANQITSF